MPKRSCLAIILAAGEGTRMRSALPKVMHTVGGLPMLGHVLDAARRPGPRASRWSSGRRRRRSRRFVGKPAPDAAIYEQTERLGTAHAVLARQEGIRQAHDDILVLYRRHAAGHGRDAEADAAGACRQGAMSWCSASGRPTRPATAG